MRKIVPREGVKGKVHGIMFWKPSCNPMSWCKSGFYINDNLKEGPNYSLNCNDGTKITCKRCLKVLLTEQKMLEEQLKWIKSGLA